MTAWSAPSIDSLLTISSTALEKVDLVKAKRCAFEALQLAQQAGNKHLEAQASYRLANAFQASENYQSASSHYQQALQLADVLGDSNLLSRALLTHASLQQKLGKPNEALMSIEHASRLAEALADSNLRLHCLLHGGNLLVHEGRMKEAQLSYLQALELSNHPGLQEIRAGIFQNLSETAAQLTHWEQAEGWAWKGIEIRIATRNEHYLNKSFENLFHQLLLQENMDQLLAAQEKYFAVLHQHGFASTPEMAEQMETFMAAIRTWRDQKDRQFLWMWLALGLGCLTFLLVLAWNHLKRKRLHTIHERLAMRIRQMEMDTDAVNVEQRMAPLRQHSNPLLAPSYLLIGGGYTQAEVGRLFGRDRATVHRWLEEIARVLDIDDVKMDAKRQFRSGL